MDSREPRRMAGAIYMIGLLLLGGAAAWTVDIVQDITVHMNEIILVPFVVHRDANLSHPHIWFTTADRNIASSNLKITMANKTSINGILNITGIFLGRTKLMFTTTEVGMEDTQEVSLITVIREERTIDTIFTASVAILVSILYINFGCAMDWKVCRDTLKKPIGPAIGFFCQFLIMPLVKIFIINMLDESSN